MTRDEAIGIGIFAHVDNALSPDRFEITPDVCIVGWRLGTNGMDHDYSEQIAFVAVRSYMSDTSGVRDVLDREDAIDLARDLLNEGLLDVGDAEPDFFFYGFPTATTTLDELGDMLSDLIEWDATVGPHENVAWDRARQVLERLLDHQRTQNGGAK